MKLANKVSVLPSRGLVALAVAVALGACQHGICEVASGDICTLAGTGNSGFSGDNGPALEADLYLPLDLTEGPDDLLYVSDWNNHRIRVITHDARIQTVAGTGEVGEGLFPGKATEVNFTHPTNIVFDDLGRMVIAAWHNSKIVRVDLTTGQLEDLAGTGVRDYTGDGGPALAAGFDLPAALAYDRAGNLHVMDHRNQVIRKIDGAGVVTRVAGQCIIEEPWGTMCMPGETPRACAGSDKLTCLTEEQPDSACVIPCAPAFAGDGGPALEARMGQFLGPATMPAGRMVFDAGGNLYFADSGNHRIRRIDTRGIITTVAGNGNQGHAGDGGPAIEAELDSPADIALADDGTLYIADPRNSCVRAITPDGIIQTVAGQCGQRGFEGDHGPATEALLDRPYGIALDRAGNLYIADTYNHRIRFVLR